MGLKIDAVVTNSIEDRETTEARWRVASNFAWHAHGQPPSSLCILLVTDMSSGRVSKVPYTRVYHMSEHALISWQYSNAVSSLEYLSHVFLVPT